MLVELEVVTDPERVGFYSGIIVSEPKGTYHNANFAQGIRFLSRKPCHQSVRVLRCFCFLINSRGSFAHELRLGPIWAKACDDIRDPRPGDLSNYFWHKPHFRDACLGPVS